jgi:4-hydroxyphenylpyruvate dioxygenase-like putative hemolysin
MNKKQEKWFWWLTTIGAYALSFYVIYQILTGTSSSKMALVHTIGMSFICFFTTSALISIYDYEWETNKNSKKKPRIKK